MSSRYSKPQSWDKYDALLTSGDLTRVLQIRLVELAMSNNPSVAVKATDLLLSMPQPEPDNLLRDLSPEELEDVSTRAREWLESIKHDSTTRINQLTTSVVLKEVDKERARKDFIVFCQYIMQDVWTTAPHHELIADHLMGIMRGDIRYLMVNMPPRHGKSFMISILFVVFWLANHPDKDIIHLSYALNLSTTFSLQSRAIIRDNFRFRELFPHVQLSKDKSAVGDWKLTAGGGLFCVGAGGGVTGHGADLIIIDDVHKEGDEQSPTTLEQTYDWFTSAVRTRLHPGGAVVIVNTRWSVLDLNGRLLEKAQEDAQADQYVHLSLPALAEENDPLGREVGEALWEERVSREDLLAIKALSERYFNALFQQNPMVSDDPMFLGSWFKRGDIIDYTNHRGLRKLWTFDFASTSKERSDYNVFVRWSLDRKGEELFVDEVVRFRAEWVGVREKLFDLIRNYLDDDFAFAKQALEMLALQEVLNEFPERRAQFHEVSLPNDKVVRANVFSSWCALGRVIVCEGDDGDYFVKEHCLFPDAGQHDDCVDASSVATHHYGLERVIDFVFASLPDSGGGEDTALTGGNGRDQGQKSLFPISPYLKKGNYYDV